MEKGVKNESLEEIHETREETHECPICLEVCTNPYTTECGHTFCKGCLMSGCHSCINKGSEEDPVAYTKCPLCRQQIKFVLFNPYTWDVVSLKDISPFCVFLDLDWNEKDRQFVCHFSRTILQYSVTRKVLNSIIEGLKPKKSRKVGRNKRTLIVCATSKQISEIYDRMNIFYHIDKKPVDKDNFFYQIIRTGGKVEAPLISIIEEIYRTLSENNS